MARGMVRTAAAVATLLFVTTASPAMAISRRGEPSPVSRGEAPADCSFEASFGDSSSNRDYLYVFGSGLPGPTVVIRSSVPLRAIDAPRTTDTMFELPTSDGQFKAAFVTEQEPASVMLTFEAGAGCQREVRAEKPPLIVECAIDFGRKPGVPRTAIDVVGFGFLQGDALRVSLVGPTGERVLVDGSLRKNGNGTFTKRVALPAPSGVYTLIARTPSCIAETSFVVSGRAAVVMIGVPDPILAPWREYDCVDLGRYVQARPVLSAGRLSVRLSFEFDARDGPCGGEPVPQIVLLSRFVTSIACNYRVDEGVEIHDPQAQNDG